LKIQLLVLFVSTISSTFLLADSNGWTKVFDKACEFTEGPALAPNGEIYLSDITFSSKCSNKYGQMTGRVWAYNPLTKKSRIVRQNSGQSNGLYFTKEGHLIAAEGASYGGRRISWFNPKTNEYRVIVDSYKGRKFNSPNDLVIDKKGRIYFTDPRYVGHEMLQIPIMGVYRVDGPGKVTRIISSILRPNGIVISPNNKTLYVAVADNGGINWLDIGATKIDPWGQGGIISYDLKSSGEVENPRIFVDLKKQGGVDGMTIDKKGNIYATVGVKKRPGIYVYSPKGKLIKVIDTPNKAHPTNVIFGKDGKIIYLTIDGTSMWAKKIY